MASTRLILGNSLPGNDHGSHHERPAGLASLKSVDRRKPMAAVLGQVLQSGQWAGLSNLESQSYGVRAY